MKILIYKVLFEFEKTTLNETKSLSIFKFTQTNSQFAN